MINFPIILFLSSILLVLISVVLIFFRDRIGRNKQYKEVKFIPLISVLCIIGSVIALNIYYLKQHDKEQTQFQQLLKNNEIIEKQRSLLTNNERQLAIDSLKAYRTLLLRAITKLKRQQYITGKNSFPIDSANAILSQTGDEIQNISSYNEIIAEKETLPNSKGYTSSGNSSNFIFNCPNDQSSEFIDLKLTFVDQRLIDKIACVFVSITQGSPLEENKPNVRSLFEQTYKVQHGVNKIKIRNYLKNPDVELEIGYILKSERLKQFPVFEKVSCKNTTLNIRGSPKDASILRRP